MTIQRPRPLLAWTTFAMTVSSSNKGGGATVLMRGERGVVYNVVYNVVLVLFASSSADVALVNFYLNSSSAN